MASGSRTSDCGLIDAAPRRNEHRSGTASIRNPRSATDDIASVIVVNFNGQHFLEECLTALERQTLPRHRYEVLLIDNGSTDGSVDFVRVRFPGVRVIPLNHNAGFTGANNVGFRMARGRWIVLLNNDTRVSDSWLESLLAAAREPDIGGVASRIVFKSDPNVLNSTGLAFLRDGRGADRDIHRPAATTRPTADDVFGGCGASLLLRRELIEDIGGFDPDLFMYYEDLDLAWRARLRGWRFVYAPGAVVEHVCGGSSSGQSPFVQRQVERNRALVNLRNASPFLALWAAIGLVLRTARAVHRFIRAPSKSGLTWQHTRGMTEAVSSVIANLPKRLLARYETRIARRRRPDCAITRFLVDRP
jgi:GT2 family glycosyltransferase